MKVNVNEFINFCTQVNSRGYLENQKSALSPEKLNELKQKSEDKNLYLGIVGEFSSGKSTLINAILHQNLLKADILQGTTCAPTFIQYGKNFDIVVKYANGKTFCFRQEHPGRTSQTLNFENGPVRDFIDKYTATEEYSAQLDRVTVYLDNPVLQNNLIIVDTPGINANARHSSVTKQTLENYCDAALILTPANAPSSEMLCAFVTENLSGLENRCIGIVSKIDTLRRPAEQDNLVETVRQKFKTELGKPLAAVLPVSAIYSQGKNENESPIRADLAKRYKDMYSDFERTIHERLIKGREKILSLHMRESVMDAIDSLQRVLEQSKQSLYTRRQNLENNQLTDMNSFLERLIPGYIDNFNAITYQVNLQEIFDDAVNYTAGSLQQDLNLCQTYDQVKNVTNNSLSKRCKSAQDNVIKKLKSIQGEFNRWSNQTCNDFQDKFANEFRNLSRDIQIAPTNINAITSISANVQNLDISHDGEFFAKGAGYIISGILGGPLGVGLFALFNMFFWNLDNAKSDAWNQMVPVLDDFFNKLLDLINNSYHNILDKTYEETLTHLSAIVDKYEPTINQIINDERNALNKLQSQLDYLGYDLKKLHQFELECTDF